MRMMAGAVVVISAAAFAVSGAPEAVPPLTAVAALLGAVWSVRRARSWLPVWAGIAGTASVVSTVGTAALSWAPLPAWGLVELPLISVLVGLIARFGAGTRVPAASAALAGIGAATCVPRFAADNLNAMGAVYGTLSWALVPIAAAMIGWYARRQQQRREDAIAAARAAQRLELARDLHDYVAHDVSDMIACVQAVELVAKDDKDNSEALALLGRVQAAGLRAMTSLDRTVGLLRDSSDGDRPNVHSYPGLADLGELAERFAATAGFPVRLDIDAAVADQVPREVDHAGYRIVAEALTNVRRHAPDASHVEIRVGRVTGFLEVSVYNNGGEHRPAASRRSGGFGLHSLAERARALGGELDAGRYDAGWRLIATLPLREMSVPT